LRQDEGGACTPLAQTADPGLARLVDAWPTLPAHIRAAVLALVDAAGRAGHSLPDR
jgi:hypothetical protein